MAAHAPLTFEPLFMERVWGGRRLAELFGKSLPEGASIGESWELVDRPEAESVVAAGELAGRTLGQLWRSPEREGLFGVTTGGPAAGADRFPLLVKLLDCEQTLSVQVHPPAAVARALGGEPKTEMWVVLDAAPSAHVYTGLRRGVTRERFEAALQAGEDVSALLFRHDVRAGDAMFLPAGRVHAIGGGSVVFEVQQNSDTTYRVYDFDRPGLDGRPRRLHVPESLRSIDWGDHEPPLLAPAGEILVESEFFTVDRLVLSGRGAPAAPPRRCAVILALDGAVACGGAELPPGRVFLVRADAEERTLTPAGPRPVSVLRAMLPA